MIDAELRELLEANAAETRKGFETLGERMARVEERLEATATRDFVLQLTEDTRRQFGILVESLRHELQLVSEHVLSNSQGIERLEARVDHLDAKVDRLWLDHEHRITKLEATSRR